MSVKIGLTVMLTIKPVSGNPKTVANYPLFDWLRFALASVVVFGHAGFHAHALVNGSLAVDVFFALSGFLIGGILLSSGKGDLPRFFFNRSTRIWIPYVFAVFILYATALIKEGISVFWLEYLFYDLTFTHQIFTNFPQALSEMPLGGSGNQFWSISVEEQFYLVAPILILFVPQGQKLWLWICLAALLILGDRHFAPISLGVCAAICQRNHQITGRIVIRRAALLSAAACLGIILWTGSVFVWNDIFAISLVIGLARPGKRSIAGEWAGGMSYPLYLNHWVGVFALNAVSKRLFEVDHGVIIVLQYIVNVVGALALYFLIDRNIQNHRARWFTPQRGKVLCATAYALVGIGTIGGLVLLHVR